MEFMETGIAMEIILWFQSWRMDWITKLFIPFHYFAHEYTFMFIIPLIYWNIDKNLGRKISILFLFSVWVNNFTKNIWKRPRPFQIPGSKIIPEVVETSYGLPSGHTMAAATFFVYLSAVLKKRWFVVVSAVFIFLMMVSRMIHGVHFPQDVIIGLLLSLVMVFGFYKFEPSVSQWISKQKIYIPLLISALVVIMMFLLFPLFNGDMEKGLETALTTTGTLFGGLTGFTLELRFLQFSTNGSRIRKLFRFLTGIAGIVVIYFGLKLLFSAILGGIYGEEAHGTLLFSAFRFLRYSALGLWFSWGAPFLFIKTGLAEK